MPVKDIVIYHHLHSNVCVQGFADLPRGLTSVQDFADLPCWLTSVQDFADLPHGLTSVQDFADLPCWLTSVQDFADLPHGLTSAQGLLCSHINTRVLLVFISYGHNAGDFSATSDMLVFSFQFRGLCNREYAATGLFVGNLLIQRVT